MILIAENYNKSDTKLLGDRFYYSFNPSFHQEVFEFFMNVFLYLLGTVWFWLTLKVPQFDNLYNSFQCGSKLICLLHK